MVDYNKDAVDKSISASNRSGNKITGKESKMIHSLLKGWRANNPKKLSEDDHESKRDVYVDGHLMVSIHAKSKKEARKKFLAAYPEHKGKHIETITNMGESTENIILKNCMKKLES